MYLIYNESTKPKIRKINEGNKYFIWDLIVMDTLEILLNGSDRMAWRGRLSTYWPQASHICNKETEDAITCIRILGFFPGILPFTTASPRLLIVSILVTQYDTTIWEPSPGLITHINPPHILNSIQYMELKRFHIFQTFSSCFHMQSLRSMFKIVCLDPYLMPYPKTDSGGLKA